jgi:hypothetical protein
LYAPWNDARGERSSLFFERLNEDIKKNFIWYSKNDKIRKLIKTLSYLKMLNAANAKVERGKVENIIKLSARLGQCAISIEKLIMKFLPLPRVFD